jgi:predicted transcriptional regulator of viral defense system
MMKNITAILKSGKTVFSINDMQQLIWQNNKNYTRLVLYRMTKNWILTRIKPGIFALPNYDIFELASKIKSKSYISFETVLQKDWVIFQDYNNTITLASNNTTTKKAGWLVFEYHKLSDFILTNTIWIENHKNNYMIASTERAVCDMIYLYKNIYFDNIYKLNIYKLEKLQNIYNKKTALLIWQLIENVKHKTA